MKETLKDLIEEIYEGVIAFIETLPLTLWDYLQSFIIILCELVIYVTVPLWILPYTIYKNNFDNKDTGEGGEE